MYLNRLTNGFLIELRENLILGVGGEGKVFALPPAPDLVAKVYHSPKPQHEAKLRAMLAYAVTDPMQDLGHTSIAWPVDLLVSHAGSAKVSGYLMPRVAGMRPVFTFYNPASRLRECPLFGYRYLLRTARNLATAVQTLHELGIVIGDVNESNILVSENALVTLVDTDSFQIKDKHTSEIYRCPVGKPQFTPPELQGLSFKEINRSIEHDLFGLAILLFQLLMEGTHPFDGVYQGGGEPPLHESRIQAGDFPYARQPRKLYQPKPSSPPFEMLSPALQALFRQCFEDGHQNPGLRPTALVWREMLAEAETRLTVCAKNPQHHFANHNLHCPWCQRTEKLGGRDPFPSREAVRQGLPERKSKAAQATLPPRNPASARAAVGLRAKAAAAAAAAQGVQTSQPLFPAPAPQAEQVGCSGCIVFVLVLGSWVGIILIFLCLLVFSRRPF
ncbi:MAG: hypothetical protein K1Y36_03920 [Blastocatellia bacterium]|nr:hypothetical protein [Blastocatellia bacterium]